MAAIGLIVLQKAVEAAPEQHFLPLVRATDADS